MNKIIEDKNLKQHEYYFIKRKHFTVNNCPFGDLIWDHL